ncbi:hypothetical protein [Rhizobium sp. CCGE531]|uniref:hypothetical protein n=1 Tax=Rhizobium sp. CCGE531 TaxID=2364271 RepID=UPI0013C46776|nr:hypothetical protein [Rhizobium sp. CCGE531]
MGLWRGGDRCQPIAVDAVPLQDETHLMFEPQSLLPRYEARGLEQSDRHHPVSAMHPDCFSLASETGIEPATESGVFGEFFPRDVEAVLTLIVRWGEEHMLHYVLGLLGIDGANSPSTPMTCRAGELDAGAAATGAASNQGRGTMSARSPGIQKVRSQPGINFSRRHDRTPA